MAQLPFQPRLQDRRLHIREKREVMNGFWWIVLYNWTLEERIELRAACEAWMAARIR